MKFSLSVLALVALGYAANVLPREAEAEPAEDLLPREAEAEPAEDLLPHDADLKPRQVGSACRVRGRGGLDGPGICRTTSACAGVSVPDFCPGTPTNVQCCRTIRCDPPLARENCRNTYKGCPGGRFTSDLCPGPETVKCCVNNQGGIPI